MDIAALYFGHPFWWWVAAALLFLAVEVATGTSYLLWPAASAAVVALLVWVLPRLPAGVDFGVFAVLTIASTLAARRYIRRPGAGPDINDPHHRLTGKHGVVVDAFVGCEGRVFVDGKEWAAELDGADTLEQGARILVVKVLDGGKLRVKPL
jgi:membrane protein implicated in regulation of membrane protease activity